MKFPHGSLVKLAKDAGISKQFLSHILTGRRQIKPDTAQKLVNAAKKQGLETSVFDWLNPDLTSNSLFKEYQS